MLSFTPSRLTEYLSQTFGNFSGFLFNRHEIVSLTSMHPCLVAIENPLWMRRITRNSLVKMAVPRSVMWYRDSDAEEGPKRFLR